MSSTPIKRQNHRIHPCNTDRKNELIQFLIGQYSGKNILIVTSNDTKELSTLLNGAIILNDAELALFQHIMQQWQLDLTDLEIEVSLSR